MIELYLSGNDLEALYKNTTLTDLNIGSNELGESAGKA
jgi:hypothetical protein